jgi:acyl-CoA thioesterase YciA
MIDPPVRMPAVRTLAMPADANPSGDIFGGWLLAQMDIAGAIPAVERAKGRVATIAVDGMTFRSPVFVGDLVSVYAEIVKTGATSITVEVEAWAQRSRGAEVTRVTHGRFTYVAIGDDRKPRPLPAEAD